MALFHAYGQSIADSGRPHISRESTKLFQTDKNYKRCKCMYEMLALAKEKLHYQSLLETYENAKDIRSLIIQELRIIEKQKCLDKQEWLQ